MDSEKCRTTNFKRIDTMGGLRKNSIFAKPRTNSLVIQTFRESPFLNLCGKALESGEYKQVVVVF
jgi:hypothetical protein